MNILFDTFWFFHSTLVSCLTKPLDNPHYHWAQTCIEHFNVKFRQIRNGNRCFNKKCIYFTNHRSEADFFIDQYLSHGKSIFISRRMVVAYFFHFLPCILISKSLLLFSRNKNNRDSLYNRIDEYWKNSPYQSLLIYPEGTRYQGFGSLPLKNGLIHYAHDRKISIQIFISTNKEKVFSLQLKQSSRNTTVCVAYSKPIHPEDYEDVEAFKWHINNIWRKTWEDAHSKTTETVEFVGGASNIKHNKILYLVVSFTLFVMNSYMYLRYPLFLLFPIISLLQPQNS